MLSQPDVPVSITPAQAYSLKRWFLRYTAYHVRKHSRHREAMVLKITHSIRVSRVSVSIGVDIGLDTDQLRLAGVVGLLHDVARFEQLVRHGTFIDRLSVDHGALGAGLLRANGIASKLTPFDRNILIEAVRYHNAPALYTDGDPATTFYLSLLRDADKLDIYRIMCDINAGISEIIPEMEASQFEHSTEVSPIVADAIMDRQVAPLTAVRSTTDFMLTRLSWVFGLQFNQTLRYLNRRGYIATLVETLPRSQAICTLLKVIFNFIDEQIA